MIRKGLIAVGLCAAATPVLVGCASTCGTARASERNVERRHEVTTVRPERPRELPSADVGDCFAQVYMPPVTKSMSEQVCVKEASQRVEVVPAKYEWVEERVLVKDASTRLEVVPAEFALTEQTIETEPGHVGWVKQSAIRCNTSEGEELDSSSNVFCLVRHAPITRTFQKQALKHDECVREVTDPAQYETVRRQKLVDKACTRTVTVPAEYQTVSKVVTVSGGRMEWQRVICDERMTADTANALKGALLTAGYDAGPLNGELDATTWTALKQFQEANGLGVGVLSYDTMNKLGVTMQ